MKDISEIEKKLQELKIEYENPPPYDSQEYDETYYWYLALKWVLE